MTSPVLRTGDFAYLDTLRNGLVPCRVLEVLDRGAMHHAIPSSSHRVMVRITATRGGYARGEVVMTSALHAIPRAAISHRRGVAYIGDYTVAVDTEERQ